jgi:hypothetical protein
MARTVEFVDAQRFVAQNGRSRYPRTTSDKVSYVCAADILAVSPAHFAPDV